jgi:hypothetical protein
VRGGMDSRFFPSFDLPDRRPGSVRPIPEVPRAAGRGGGADGSTSDGDDDDDRGDGDGDDEGNRAIRKGAECAPAIF